MNNEDERKDDFEAIVTSSINKAIGVMKKSGVVIIIVPGEVVFAYDIPTFVYDSDNQLHSWLKEALDKHIILLKASDEKIQKTIEIAHQCHFDVFTVLDFPEQKVSGSAYSMTSSLPRILQSEIEMFGKVTEAEPQKLEVDVVVTPPVNADVKETPQGRFNSITRAL